MRSDSVSACEDDEDQVLATPRVAAGAAARGA